MRASFSETVLALACLGLLAVAVWAPGVVQPGHYHAFADARTIWGLPHAMDVLSNLPWTLLQFGGMVLVGWFAGLRPRYRALGIRWSLVILVYGVAKLLEMNDHEVYQFTDHLVSGHTLKHAVASLAAWPVIMALRALRESRQNAPSFASIEGGARRRARRVTADQ